MKAYIRELLNRDLESSPPESRVAVTRKLRAAPGKRPVIDGKMRCRTCGKVKSLTEFYIHVSVAKKTKHYDSNCDDCRKLRMVVRRTGISITEYRRLVKASNGICAICLRPYKRPSIDHCHASGKTRGVLCSACNAALGLFRDLPEVIRRAADYLESAR